MTMKDKIAQRLAAADRDQRPYPETADAIIAALPDHDALQKRIKELEANVDLKTNWIHRTMSGMGSDAQRIKELEAALGEFARFASRKEKSGASVPFGQSKLHAARAALKGED